MTEIQLNGKGLFMIEKYLELADEQKGIYIDCMNGHSIDYNISLVAEISNLNYSEFKKAVGYVTREQELLRSCIIEKDGEPCIVIYDNIELPIVFTDMSQKSKAEIEKTTDDFLKSNFEIDKVALFKVGVIKISDTQSYIMVNIHHIISDGISTSLLLNKIIDYYNKIIDDITIEEKIDNGYEVFIANQKKKAASPSYLKKKERWKEHLEGAEPTDLRINVACSDKVSGREMISSLPCGLAETIRQRCKENEVTEFSFYLAAFFCFLHKYSRSDNILISVPFASRDDLRTSETIGCFVSDLPLRMNLSAEDNFADILQKSFKEILFAYKNIDYPTHLILEENFDSLLKAHYADISFVYDVYEIKKDKTQISLVNTEQKNYFGGLTFSLNSSNGYDYNIVVEYRNDLLSEDTVKHMSESYISILNTVSENVDLKVDNIDIISEEECKIILSVFNTSENRYPRDKTIAELFEEQVKKTPDSIAVVYKNEKLTYSELNARANSLANRLREMGVKPDDFVAIIADRSMEMICGIYGIIKAGGAYVPIDPTYPEDRISYMIEDCKPKAILKYTAEGVEPGAEIPVIDLGKNVWEDASENPELVNKPSDLIYCIYTSGTTGKPKGVILENTGLVGLIKSYEEVFEMSSDDRMMQYASYCFDQSVGDIFGAMLNGAALYVVSSEMRYNTTELEEYMKREKITVASLTPKVIRELDICRMPELRLLDSGGEAAELDVLTGVAASGKKVINSYGPTEATVNTTYSEINADTEKVVIGTPSCHTQVYIMNGDSLSGIGVPGELCIAGDCLARGYLNRAELTAEKFVKNPFGEGRMYRSGDLARWLSDGNIEYLGRIDEQVKIRGFRIELGEIERQIREIESVKDCAVIARADASGDKALYAYYTSDSELSVSEIRDRLSENLPEYMVPAYMMQIESIPVTTNGKLDKKALPEIEAKAAREYAAPRSEEEKVLCRIFSEILCTEKVGIHDYFFELGGDSIKAIRMISKLRNEGYSLKVKDIMSGSNVEKTALSLKKEKSSLTYEQNEIVGKVEYTPIIQEFFDSNYPVPEHYNQALMISVNGIDNSIIRSAVEEIVKHHDMLRAVYRNGELSILPTAQSKLCDFYEFDYSNVKDKHESIKEKCTKIQRSIDLENGPFVKAAIFDLGDEKTAMLCVHHLAVDGVSWRIILEDFDTAVEQLKNEEKVKFAEKTASFIEWSRKLRKYGETLSSKDRKFWTEISKEMPDAFISGSYSESRAGSTEIEFDEQITSYLLQKSLNINGAKIDEVLLAGLAMTVGKLTGQNKLAVMLEGHGREEIGVPIMIDRTVGWFTNVYSVILECSDDFSDAIVLSKDAIRRIPASGMGYGYVEHTLKPDICFNYLGDFDGNSDISEKYSCGLNCAEENADDNITMNGIVSSNRLRFTIKSGNKRFGQKFVDDLADEYRKTVIQLAEYCSENVNDEKTASDMSVKNLDKSEIDLINLLFI